MGKWHDVTAADDIDPGGFALLETDDLTAAVFNVDGTLYAIEDVCTHAGRRPGGRGSNHLPPARGAFLPAHRPGADSAGL
jgi:nitrite reductase/ring-hydroxylating ferredoxin subunit